MYVYIIYIYADQIFGKKTKDISVVFRYKFYQKFKFQEYASIQCNLQLSIQCNFLKRRLEG